METLDASLQGIAKYEYQSDEILNIKISDEDFLKKTKALSSKTRVNILRIISHENVDVSSLAKRLNQTEANISAQIKILSKAGLIDSLYQPGQHGIRKISHIKFSKLIITL